MKALLAAVFLVVTSFVAQSQGKKKSLTLNDTVGLTAIHVQMKADTYEGKKSVNLLDTGQGNFSVVKYAKLKEMSFHNGTIELELAGKPLNTAGESARGFIGIAFRIDESDTKFECMYLRPTNGRAEDQVRRNHSAQYISHPNFTWQKLRQETPEKYESYVDLEVGKWTKVKIVVQDGRAKLYVHGAEQPTLIVSDLKHGATHKGTIGLWIGPGTDAHFRNLVVTSTD